MTTKGRAVALAVLNGLALLATLVVNGLANGLPLNGRGTGEISDSYPSLFVPAGLTFAIWGPIYLLLTAFCVYGLAVTLRSRPGASSIARIGPLFIVSSVANSLWIFAWHWERIGLSVILMLVLLVALILTYLRLDIGRARVGLGERLLVHAPFSVYLGWITVATIANVTALLVSIDWSGFGLPAATWTVAVIVVAVVITLLVILTRRDLAYTLVIVWALVGIYLKRSSPTETPAPAVAWTALVCAGLLLLAAPIGYAVVSRRRVAREPKPPEGGT